jgi:hypothetical protein
MMLDGTASDMLELDSEIVAVAVSTALTPMVQGTVPAPVIAASAQTSTVSWGGGGGPPGVTVMVCLKVILPSLAVTVSTWLDVTFLATNWQGGSPCAGGTQQSSGMDDRAALVLLRMLISALGVPVTAQRNVDPLCTVPGQVRPVRTGVAAYSVPTPTIKATMQINRRVFPIGLPSFKEVW